MRPHFALCAARLTHVIVVVVVVCRLVVGRTRAQVNNARFGWRFYYGHPYYLSVVRTTIAYLCRIRARERSKCLASLQNTVFCVHRKASRVTKFGKKATRPNVVDARQRRKSAESRV